MVISGRNYDIEEAEQKGFVPKPKKFTVSEVKELFKKYHSEELDNLMRLLTLYQKKIQQRAKLICDFMNRKYNISFVNHKCDSYIRNTNTGICERCGHEWYSRSKVKPRVCPKCKSPYWDKPRS